MKRIRELIFKSICKFLYRYCGDSILKKIFVWDYDEEFGILSNCCFFFDIVFLFEGVLDGVIIDDDGYLWVCFYDG